jgi:hypothetical protein
MHSQVCLNKVMPLMVLVLKIHLVSRLLSMSLQWVDEDEEADKEDFDISNLQNMSNFDLGGAGALRNKGHCIDIFLIISQQTSLASNVMIASRFGTRTRKTSAFQHAG